MCYEIEFNIVDSETGEVLTRNQRKTIITEYTDTPAIFNSWLDCFYRGLCQGRSLALELYATPFVPPKQLDIF